MLLLPRTKSVLVVVMADTLLILCWADLFGLMKFMIGGVHPWTRHDLQHVDAQRSLLVGRSLGFSCDLVQARGDGLGANKSFVCPSWSGTMIC